MNKRGSNSITNNIERSSLFKILIFAFILIVIVFVSFYFNSRNASAEISTNRNKQVVSIQIESGDTLWGIAKEYITEEYNDINQYIEEIKSCNGLFEDTIHEGNHLIVPYYTDNDNMNNSDIVSFTSVINY